MTSYKYRIISWYKINNPTRLVGVPIIIYTNIENPGSNLEWMRGMMSSVNEILDDFWFWHLTRRYGRKRLVYTRRDVRPFKTR